MAKKQQKYDMEYKIRTVKLAKEIGGAKAAVILSILVDTEPLTYNLREMCPEEDMSEIVRLCGALRKEL